MVVVAGGTRILDLWRKVHEVLTMLFPPLSLDGEPGRQAAGKFLSVPNSSVEICVSQVPFTLQDEPWGWGCVHWAESAFDTAVDGAVRESAPRQPVFPLLAWKGFMGHAMEGSWGLPEAETFGCIVYCLSNREEETGKLCQGGTLRSSLKNQQFHPHLKPRANAWSRPLCVGLRGRERTH